MPYSERRKRLIGLACSLCLAAAGCAESRPATAAPPVTAVPAAASAPGLPDGAATPSTAATPPAAVSASTPQAPAIRPVPKFTDLPVGFWATGAIDAMAAAGVVQGMAPGRFDPAAPVTRAEWAALLLRLAGDPGNPVGPVFRDVTHGDWFYEAVEAATGRGWMQGVAAGRFAPDRAVTRAQAAVALAAYLGLGRVAQDEATLPCTFSDCSAIPAWAVGAVHVAADLGLLRGTIARRLRPNAPLDRAQAAALLARLQAVRPAAVAREGERVAASAYIEAGAPAVAVGGTLTVHAYAHDRAGYIVPAAFTFTLSGPATLTAGGGSAVTLRASAAGVIHVEASTAGGRVRTSLAISALRAASLSAAGLPPEGLAGATFPVMLRILDSADGIDTAAGGIARVAAAPRQGGRGDPATQAAITAGQAQLTLPVLPPGLYTLTFTAPRVPALHVQYTVVRRPVGAIQPQRAIPALAHGAQAALTVVLPGGPWPLRVSATQHPAGAPPATGAAPEAVASWSAVPASLQNTGTAAILRGLQPGTAAITVSVPGGALRPATVHLRVLPAGSFHAATGTESQASAGAAITLAVGLHGPAASVAVEPVDPAGHPLQSLPATIRGPEAVAHFVPLGAGRWSFLWTAPGFAPAMGAPVLVRPGPPVHLVVDPTPTSVLLPGQAAELRAWLADAAGNPAPVPFRITVSGTTCAAGTFQGGDALAGPADFGSFLARDPGTCTLTFRSPDHPSAGTARVIFRTVANIGDIVAGKGLWLTYPDWRGNSDARLLATAAADGATHLYLEVATTTDGFYGGPALDDLLRQAHADGLAVIAWVYAALGDPAADAANVRQVANYLTPTGDLADGLALDIEDHLAVSAVSSFARRAAAALGPGGLVVGVTWAPQQKPSYPYRALAPYVSAFAPMDYWHVLPEVYTYAQVYNWVLRSVRILRRDAGRPTVPVDVITETFDWFAGDSGQGLFSPTPQELSAAMRAASDAGATGVSFYRATTATPAEQAVIMDTPWPPAG